MAEENKVIRLSRTCEAIQIPSGEKLTLPKGTEVRITQSLGGAFTVVTDSGYMVRISGKDADALGHGPSQTTSPTRSQPTGKTISELVWDQLKTCYDPEISANIVDLGLIYDCKVTPLAAAEYKVDIKMTLTAPGCGMGASIASDAKYKIQEIPGVKEVSVDLVWDPPWNPAMMSEAAKQQLGLI